MRCIIDCLKEAGAAAALECDRSRAQPTNENNENKAAAHRRQGGGNE
jgi:hypothetical protein